MPGLRFPEKTEPVREPDHDPHSCEVSSRSLFVLVGSFKILYQGFMGFVIRRYETKQWFQDFQVDITSALQYLPRAMQ